jgi:hypothetical protein
VSAAPAVALRCADDRGWRTANAMLHAAAAAVLLLWLAGWLEWSSEWATLAAAIAATPAALLGWRAAAPRAQGLRWDGRAWTLHDGAGEHPGQVRVALDLDAWMLLRFDAADRRTCWLPVGRRSAGAAWRDLRIALHATVRRADEGR